MIDTTYHDYVSPFRAARLVAIALSSLQRMESGDSGSLVASDGFDYPDIYSMSQDFIEDIECYRQGVISKIWKDEVGMIAPDGRPMISYSKAMNIVLDTIGCLEHAAEIEVLSSYYDYLTCARTVVDSLIPCRFIAEQ